MQELMKHVCKFCKKSFPCGRSLGGHMRSHMSNNNNNSNSAIATAIDESKTNKQSCNNRVVSSSVTSADGYGLRENPKKTWRLISDSNNSIADGPNPNFNSRLCKQCGKGFQSWKALFGHMRCHSDKPSNNHKNSNNINNNCFEDDSWTAQSDNELGQAPKKRRRSRRRVSTKYNRAATTATTTATTTTATTNSSSFSYANNNGSVSVSEIEQEQEEVAMSLMMLSRDVGNWGGFVVMNNSAVESSDNNSVSVVVVEEDRSNVRCERRISEFGGSNFGGFRNGYSKKFDSEVSDDKIERHREDCDAQLGRNSVKCSEDQAYASDDDDDDKCDSSKKIMSYFSPFDPQTVVGEVSKSMRSNLEMGIKKSKFECTTCNKVFHSYQALGGHRASHKRTKGCFASKIDGSENSIEIDIDNDDLPMEECPIGGEKLQDLGLVGGGCGEGFSHASKKSKHECPVCLKVFSSGQALGGHKRSHMVEGGAEARANQSIIIQQKLPAIRDLLDLNLPAPIEEESNGHIGLKPWWIGTNPKHEPVAAALNL